MRPNRKADLQRKLALAPVPKPPAGLADRIKNEIPKQLRFDADKERTRLRQAVAFNVRVAASIILLVSSVYLAMHLLSRTYEAADVTAAKRSVPVVVPTAAVAKQVAAAPQVAAPVAPSPPPAAKPEERKPVIVAEARPKALMTRERDAENKEQGKGKEEEGKLAGVSYDAAAPRMAKAAAAPAASAAVPLPIVEASAAPFDATIQMVRIGLANAEIIFNNAAVASSRRITASLYEVTLRPPVDDSEVIVTVRAGAGEWTIRRGEVRAWNDASREMKAASLQAALDEGAPPRDVAAKARAAGLDDLAAAAEKREPR